MAIEDRSKLETGVRSNKIKLSNGMMANRGLVLIQTRARFCPTLTNAMEEDQEGIAVLPLELQALILLQTDSATRPLLRCVSHTWDALLRDRRTRLNPNCKVHEWYGLGCGLARCLSRQACFDRFVRKTVQHRRWTVLFWLHCAPSNYNVCKVAGSDGDLERLQMLIGQGFALEPGSASKEAARYGRRNVLEWLCANAKLSPSAKNDALWDAAKYGHFGVVKWLHLEQGCALQPRAYIRAFNRRDTDMIQWLQDHGCPKSTMVCEKVAKRGYIDMLKMARAMGFKWDHDTYKKAAAGGHIDVLTWARENGCPGYNSTACEAAARAGHLHVLQWLRANGCTWDTSTPYAASSGGHLHVLIWAIENGCPRHQCLMRPAVQGGNIDVIQWVLANGGSWDGSTYCIALDKGHLHVADWARKQGYIWGANYRLFYEACSTAASKGDLAALEWLSTIERLDDSYLCQRAAASGHIRVLVWLRAHRCSWDARVITEAVRNEHWNVVEWARTNGCPEP